MSEKLLQEFIDYKAIVELKARFVHTVDAKDWDGFRSVFTPLEGVFDFGGGFVVEGGDAFVDAVAGQLENATSVHRAFLPRIAFEGAGQARREAATAGEWATGEWAVNDYIEWSPDPATGERRGQQGFGYEYETYRRTAGGWKIAGWRLHYIRLDPLPPAQPPLYSPSCSVLWAGHA
jgi:hypothetical protein